MPSKQSDFCAGYTCTTAMDHVIGDIIRAKDSYNIFNLFIVLILLDFMKAIDFLNHNILPSILHYFDFSTNVSTLMHTLLVNRSQRVQINNNIFLNGSTGVPQGNILGQLLFSLYLSSFHTHVKYCNYH